MSSSNDEIYRLAEWLARNTDRWVKDHACARCVPHSDMLEEGFRCVPHQAIDILADMLVTTKSTVEIREGDEFFGEEYVDEMKRLMSQGREFEYRWIKDWYPVDSSWLENYHRDVPRYVYRMVPQKEA